jgi:hypothetical protein
MWSLSRTRRSRAAGSGGFFGPPTLHRGPDEPQYFADHRRRNPLYRKGFRCNYTFGTGTLPDYLLSKGPNEPFFAAAESVYDKVKDGEKIFASTKAEVGARVCA